MLAEQMHKAKNEASQTEIESKNESFNKGLEYWLKNQIEARKSPAKAHTKVFKEN